MHCKDGRIAPTAGFGGKGTAVLPGGGLRQPLVEL